MLQRLQHAETSSSFAAEICAGLTRPEQKELPSKFLYDEVGSALFEAISVLPEYGLTRADVRLLRQHAPDIVSRLPLPVIVAELGTGSGKKTRWLLEALARRRPSCYCPIEISRSALAMCRRELGDIEAISIVGYEGEYLEGLARVAARRRDGEHLLVLFLGSTIGNFERPAAVEFLREVRRILRTGDSLLLGTDLEKPVAQLLAAYDDPLGITAAFNLNLLARINRELDADFMLPRFRHLARYNAAARSIEMYLRSTCAQTVTLREVGLAITLHEGETIWTESCHKYAAGEVPELATKAGYHCEAQWVDQEWSFAESLMFAV
jgi:dimethylhistidine N-methyltransferase